MRKIKFRGKNAKGENVFVEFEEPPVFDGEEVTDVAHFVGYDKNGAEIYDGDILVDDFGAKVKATIGFNLSYDKLIRPIGEKVGIVEVVKDD